jgi:hypothetical protein
MTIASPTQERRWDLGAWLTLIVAVGWSVVVLGTSLAGLSYPSDGWTIRRDTVNGQSQVNFRFHGGPTPLHADDAVVAIDDQPIGVREAAPVGRGTLPGQVLLYTVERDQERLDFAVTLAAPGPAGVWAALRNRLAEPRDALVATASLVVALATFLLRPGNLGARYLLLTFSYYFATSWFGFMASELYLHLMPLQLQALQALAGAGWIWFFFPSMTLLALSVPVVKGPLRRFPRLLPGLLYGVPFVAALLSFGPDLLWDDQRWLPVGFAGFLVVIALMVVALSGSLIHNWVTLREPAARAQLRWVGLGLVLGLLVPFSWLLLNVSLWGQFGSDLGLWLPLCLPVALAIAITRYRLWDIDVIIRRTLIYTVLTGLLVLAYFGSVLVLENVFRALTGQGQNSLVVVLSTLTIAALVGPLRRRVQVAIDHRFFRRKYDAARTLARFAANARDETGLDQLSAHLVQVVDQTMQPESVGLWLRPGAENGQERSKT